MYCFHRGSGVPGAGKNADISGCWNVGGDPGEDYCTAHFDKSPHLVLADKHRPNLLVINDGKDHFLQI